MPTETVWTCTGCGASDKSTDELPRGWAQVSIRQRRVSNYPARPLVNEGAYDLCQSCWTIVSKRIFIESYTQVGDKVYVQEEDNPLAKKGA